MLKSFSFSDLGVGHKDWLQLLQEKANENNQKECYTKSSIKTKTYERIAKDDSVSQNFQTEEKTRSDLDKYEQKQMQNETISVDAVTSHQSVKGQYKRQKDELDESLGYSSIHSQEMIKTRPSLEEAPATPLSAFLNTSLSSPTLLLPHGWYWWSYFFLLGELLTDDIM